MGADGRGGPMHAGRFLGTVPPGVAVSAADAARAFVGTSVEVGLADHRCAPDVAFRSSSSPPFLY